MAKQSRLTKSARGQECSLHIHPYCNGNNETTVLAHINSERKGWGIKSPDHFAVFACSECHDVIDGRRKTDIDDAEIQRCILRGLYGTWLVWIDMEIIKVD